MALQTGIVYGPMDSRRFGRSLGINLAPAGRKACSFDCTYCEYGPSTVQPRTGFPVPADVVDALDAALFHHTDIDTIVVAGNGEPTLHQAFAPIAQGLWDVRRRRAPQAKLALVSNGSTLNRLDVMYSLARFDLRCMKLDAGDETTFRLMNAPMISLGRLIADLRFIGQLTLQSRFVRDAARGIDNTTPPALDAWLDAVARVQPASVDISALEWPSLPRVPESILEEIATRVRGLGVAATVYG